MFRNLLNPENGLMITMSKITDVIFLSLFWMILCFPLVTVGPATAALYDATVRNFRKGEQGSWRRFWRSFKQNLKVGIPVTILWLIAFAALGKGMIALWNGAVAGSVPWPVFSGAALAAVLLVGVLSVMFPLLSRFETTPGRLVSNTVIIGLGNMPRTLALGALNTLAGFVCIRFLVPVFLMPCLAALIGSFFVEPMLRPYMPQETAPAEE